MKKYKYPCLLTFFGFSLPWLMALAHRNPPEVVIARFGDYFVLAVANTIPFILYSLLILFLFPRIFRAMQKHSHIIQYGEVSIGISLACNSFFFMYLFAKDPDFSSDPFVCFILFVFPLFYIASALLGLVVGVITGAVGQYFEKHSFKKGTKGRIS